MRLAHKIKMVIGISSRCPYYIFIYFKITSSSGRSPCYRDIHVEGVDCIQRITTRSLNPHSVVQSYNAMQFELGNVMLNFFNIEGATRS